MNHSNQDESRRQFEEAFRNWHPDKTGPYMKHVAEYFWLAGRESLNPQKIATSEKVRQELWQRKFGDK